MPSDQIKVQKLISQLTKLTSQEKLTWEVSHAPPAISEGTDDVIPLYFQTHYKGQAICLFQRRYQSFSEEYERLYWKEHIALAFLDSANRVLWEYTEQTYSLMNLFDVVRTSVADVSGIVDRLINDDDDEHE